MDKNELNEANRICQHSPIRIGWAMRQTGEHEIILGFDRPMNGIGIPLDDAERLIESMQATLQEAKNHLDSIKKN